MTAAVLPFGGALTIAQQPTRRWMPPKLPPDAGETVAFWAGCLCISLAGHYALFSVAQWGINNGINLFYYLNVI